MSWLTLALARDAAGAYNLSGGGARLPVGVGCKYAKGHVGLFVHRAVRARSSLNELHRQYRRRFTALLAGHLTVQGFGRRLAPHI